MSTARLHRDLRRALRHHQTLGDRAGLAIARRIIDPALICPVLETSTRTVAPPGAAVTLRWEAMATAPPLVAPLHAVVGAPLT